MTILKRYYNPEQQISPQYTNILNRTLNEN